MGIGVFAGYAASNIKFHDFTFRANAAKKLMVMTKDDALTFTNMTLTNLSADSITVPANGTFYAVVRFSAESACSASSWCSAVISVDGVAANPKSGTDFAFDSPGGETWQSLIMDRTSDALVGTGSPRNVNVSVDVAVIGGGSWRLDDWSVVTELFKA